MSCLRYAFDDILPLSIGANLKTTDDSMPKWRYRTTAMRFRNTSSSSRWKPKRGYSRKTTSSLKLSHKWRTIGKNNNLQFPRRRMLASGYRGLSTSKPHGFASVTGSCQCRPPMTCRRNWSWQTTIFISMPSDQHGTQGLATPHVLSSPESVELASSALGPAFNEIRRIWAQSSGWNGMDELERQGFSLPPESGVAEKATPVERD